MRGALALALAVVLVSAGCLGGTDGSEEPSASHTGGAEAPLPAPIHDQRTVEMKVSPLATAQGAPCQTEASNCYRYAFDLGQQAQVQARLDWTNATNDFDLHVVDGEGQTVTASKGSPPSTQEEIDATVDPGSYELVVVAWAVQSDTYALDAQFGYP